MNQSYDLRIPFCYIFLRQNITFFDFYIPQSPEIILWFKIFNNICVIYLATRKMQVS